MLHQSRGHRPEDEDDLSVRDQNTLAFIYSDDREWRIEGVRRILTDYVGVLTCYVARRSDLAALRALWDWKSRTLDQDAFDEVWNEMALVIYQKAEAGSFPEIENLPGYVVGVFRGVARDLWRKRWLHYDETDRSFQVEAIVDHRSTAEETDEARELKKMLLEDIRDYVREVTQKSTKNRVILVRGLVIDSRQLPKKVKNDRLFVTVNQELERRSRLDGPEKPGSQPMSRDSLRRQFKRLWHGLLQHLRERGWNVT
jgi:hypothetical protein